MIKKKNESGRSMVEMLGVLAIIGVLSIGGIAGYTMSMRRHRANQVLDLMNKYALVVYSGCQKAIIDGNISTITACDDEGYQIPFTDSNLGTAPELWAIIPYGFTQESGVDILSINIHFNDLEICKATKSIVGSKYDYDCTGNGSNAMTLKFKQN